LLVADDRLGAVAEELQDLAGVSESDCGALQVIAVLKCSGGFAKSLDRFEVCIFTLFRAELLGFGEDRFCGLKSVGGTG
jgi:hypothetical protein